MKLKDICLAAAVIFTFSMSTAKAGVSADRLFSECDARSDFCRGLLIGFLEGDLIYFERTQAIAKKHPLLGPEVAKNLTYTQSSWCFPAAYEAIAQRSLAEFADRVWTDLKPELRSQIRDRKWDTGSYPVNISGQNVLGASLSKAFSCDKPNDQIWHASPIW